VVEASVDGHSELYYSVLSSELVVLVDQAPLSKEDAFASGSASIAIDRFDNAHIVWSDMLSDSADILYTRIAPDFGRLFDSFLLVGGTSSSKGPSIDVDGMLNIHLAWRDSRDRVSDPYITVHKTYYSEFDAFMNCLVQPVRIGSLDRLSSNSVCLKMDGLGRAVLVYDTFQSGSHSGDGLWVAFIGPGGTILDHREVYSQTYISDPCLGIGPDSSVRIGFNHYGGLWRVYYMVGELQVPSPTGLRAAAGHGYINLTWDFKASAHSSEVWFKIYRKGASESYCTQIGETRERGYNDSGLQDFTYYTYQVRAWVESGQTADSEAVRACAMGVQIVLRHSIDDFLDIDTANSTVRVAYDDSSLGTLTLMMFNCQSQSISYEIISGGVAHILDFYRTGTIPAGGTRSAWAAVDLTGISNAGEVRVLLADRYYFEFWVTVNLSSQRLCTSFSYEQCAFGFTNPSDEYSGGYCFGMSSISVLWYEESQSPGSTPIKQEMPPVRDLNKLDWEDCFWTIYAYQFDQAPPLIYPNNIDMIFEKLQAGQVVQVSLSGGGPDTNHAVVAIGAVVLGDKVLIQLYDPNRQYGNTFGWFSYATYNQTTGAFSYHGSEVWTEFYAHDTDRLEPAKVDVFASFKDWGILQPLPGIFRHTLGGLLAVLECPVKMYFVDEQGKVEGNFSGNLREEMAGSVYHDLSGMSLIQLSEWGTGTIVLHLNAQAECWFNLTLIDFGTSRLLRISGLHILPGEDVSVSLSLGLENTTVNHPGAQSLIRLAVATVGATQEVLTENITTPLSAGTQGLGIVVNDWSGLGEAGGTHIELIVDSPSGQGGSQVLNMEILAPLIIAGAIVLFICVALVIRRRKK